MTVDKYNYMTKGELRAKIRELEVELERRRAELVERLAAGREKTRRKWVDRHDGTGEHLEDVEK